MHNNLETIQFKLNPTLEKCRTSKNQLNNKDTLLCLLHLSVNVITNNGAEEIKVSKVELFSKSGYIFIQTDRPVYKPKEKGITYFKQCIRNYSYFIYLFLN